MSYNVTFHKVFKYCWNSCSSFFGNARRFVGTVEFIWKRDESVSCTIGSSRLDGKEGKK